MIKRILIIAIYFVFHITLLREVRTTIFQYQMNNSFVDKIESDEHAYIKVLDTRVINIATVNDGIEQVWVYKVPFGFFFLGSVLALIFFKATKKYYLTLVISHGIAIILSSMVFYIYDPDLKWLLPVIDIISVYLVPLVSIGVIPLAFTEYRKV